MNDQMLRELLERLLSEQQHRRQSAWWIRSTYQLFFVALPIGIVIGGLFVVVVGSWLGVFDSGPVPPSGY